MNAMEMSEALILVIHIIVATKKYIFQNPGLLYKKLKCFRLVSLETFNQTNNNNNNDI